MNIFQINIKAMAICIAVVSLLSNFNQAKAYDFLVDGIYYNIVDGKAVVTYPNESRPSSDDPSPYSGNIVIPVSITADENTYQVTALGDYAFFYSSITAITLPEGLLSIGKQALCRCGNLKEIVIPNTVTTTGFDAIGYCSSLTKVTIGNGMEELSQGFCYSSPVSEVYLNPTTPPSISTYIFSSNPKIYVKVNALENYKTSTDSKHNWASFGSFESTNDANYTYFDIQQLLPTYGSTEYTGGTAPGYCSLTSLDKYTKAVTTAKALTEDSPLSETVIAAKALLENQPELIPITEGYYRIISAGNGQGYAGGPYNYENKLAWYNEDGIVKWSLYDTNDYGMVYRFSKNGDNWIIRNLKDETYVGNGDNAFGGKVLTTDTEVEQTAIWACEGKFMLRTENNKYIYSITNSHNGSAENQGNLSIWGTEAEGVNYGVNLWYISPVSEEIVEYLEENDIKKSYIISDTPSKPEPGKTYVIKNATKDYYITSSGPMTSTVTNEPEYFWQIEETGNTIDQNSTYYLKSVSLNGYWQDVNFADQTWSDGSPYDGYDWYDYAGMNAEFGAIETAAQMTILAAGSTSNWRSENASVGYVLALKDVVQTTKGSYYYKLGTQDNNVAFEPWNENVGWYFYPVTNSANVFEQLQNTIETYDNIDADIQTSNDPGYYSATKMEAYRQSLETAKNVTGTESKKEIKTIINDLVEKATAAMEVNPIREGYFYIVTAGNGPGYSGGPYNYEWQSALYNNGDLVSYKAYDPEDFDQIYHFSSDGKGNWYIQSALYGTYIDKSSASYAKTVNTSLTANTSQIFYNASEGKFTFKFNGNNYIYSMRASHNGNSNPNGDLYVWGTPEEGIKYGVNVWYIHEVPKDVMDKFARTDAGLASLCSEYSALANSLVAGDEPGYYIQENIDSLKNTIAEAKEMILASTTDEDKVAIRNKLKNAADYACQVNPITDGYYYLTSNYDAYKTNFGNYPAIYTAPKFNLSETGSACYYDLFDSSNANYIYKVVKTDGDDTYTLQNVYTGWFLNTGDGHNAAGEILTCTSTPVNNQIIKWYDAGKYWISDETDSSVGHAIANAASINKRDFVIGGTSYDASVSSSLLGYNTWALKPISEETVQSIISTYTLKDQVRTEAFNKMKNYNDSITSRINLILNDKGNNFNSDAVINLRSKQTILQKYVNSFNYDITTPAETYNAVAADLQDALEKALTEKPDSTTTTQLIGTPIGAVSVDYNTSAQSTTVNTPDCVFDSNYDTFYASYERSTGWVGLDLGEPYVITKIAYAPRTSYASRMLLGIFEGANNEDFSDAIPFYMIKETPSYNEMTYADIDCTRGFRYVRYVGPNDVRCNVSEIRFYGTRGEGDDSHLYQVTNIPTVVIRTQANVSEVTSKTTWLNGMATVIFDDGTSFKSDTAGVRGRGNGSWTFVKKPYKLKFNSKHKLCHMPAKAKEWTLINNYGDKTMIRNNVAFEISRILQFDYTPACTLVDVIFNGQYKGSYQLCDQIEVRKNRVDITEMTPEDNSGEALTGGYLIELDAYASGEPKHFSSAKYGIPVTVHYPDNDEITNEQYAYIKQAFDDVCERVYSTNYKDSIQGYKSVMDEETWLKYFLLEELSGNTDGYWSTYMFKDRNDKFRTGPGWDFDLAFDNDRRTHPILTMTDFLSLSSKSSAASGVRSFNRKIVESCTNELKELWSWYRYREDLTYEHLKQCVDSLGELNTASATLNYKRWDILNTTTQQQYTVRGSYAAEVEFLNEYLYDRIAWMDNKVGLEEPIGIHSTIDTEARGGIHGHSGYVLIRGFAEGSTISIYNTNGALVSNTKVYDFDNKFDLPKGIYIVRVTDRNGNTSTQKVAVK